MWSVPFLVLPTDLRVFTRPRGGTDLYPKVYGGKTARARWRALYGAARAHRKAMAFLLLHNGNLVEVL